MKEINDKSIDLDALFEGKSFEMLDASTQAYVLKEFGSREEYESMSHSFKRIRTVITEEDEIEADDKVKADLLALFEKEDRKVVPLIPGKTSGLAFLRSPYFQMGVAASLVIVALFFIPWGGNQDNQLAMADHKEAKISPEGKLSEPAEAFSGDSSIQPEEKLNETPNRNEMRADGSGVNDKEADVENAEAMKSITTEESKPDANVNEVPAQAEEIALEDARKEEIKATTKLEKESLAKNNNTSNNVSDNIKDKSADRDKGNSDVLARVTTTDTKAKKKELSGDSNEKTAPMNAGAVSPVNANSPGKKPVNGVSLGEKKDLMQFFNTAL